MSLGLLIDVALLVTFAIAALCANSSGARLSGALCLFGLVCVDLVSQLPVMNDLVYF